MGRSHRRAIPNGVADAIDCGFDEIGARKASDIVMLTLRTLHAAPVAFSRSWRRGPRQLLEPTAPLHIAAISVAFVSDGWAATCCAWVSRQKEYATPCWWGLAPRNVKRVYAFWLAAVCCVVLFNLTSIDLALISIRST